MQAKGSQLALDDKYDDIKKLIDVGKEKGYLTYNEVNDLIPHDVHSPDDLDDLLTTIGTQGIDVLEGPEAPLRRSSRQAVTMARSKPAKTWSSTSLPAALEKTNDPVRMYLREMGTVPLLTREGEVEIAKRIERGQLRVLKALSRSPIVIRDIARHRRRPEARSALHQRSRALRRRRNHRRGSTNRLKEITGRDR